MYGLLTSTTQSNMLPDDRQSMQEKLRRELEASQWLQTYRHMGQSLLALKKHIPLSTLCKVEWKTDTNTLLIRCPNAEVYEDLQQQVAAIRDLQIAASSIVIRYEGYPDIPVE